MFDALKVRDFRLYWLGMFVSLIGTWVQQMAQSWLVYQLTNSAFLLGLVGFFSAVPIFLLSLFGGVVADRASKRTLLIFTQVTFMTLAFFLGFLTQFRLIRVWQVMLIALLNGAVMAFDAPARQAVVLELVNRRYLLNAIALNSAAFNGARMLGPVLAGLLISIIGIAGCFYLNGLSFIAIIAALVFIRGPRRETGYNGKALIEDLREGLNYIKANRQVLILLIMSAVPSLFGMSYMLLAPIFAKEVFKLGASGLGYLMSAAGIGALLASLALAGYSGLRKRGRFLIASSLLFSVALTAFAFSTSFIFSLTLLGMIGFGSVASAATINTLLQTIIQDEFRGRVMSAFLLTFTGTMPFGNLFAGSLAHFFGVRMAVAIGGFICLGFSLFVTFFRPGVRRIQ